jgi:hypothetical protein
VLDARWCPDCSTAFAAVTAGGRLELWDLAASAVRPAAAHAAPRVRMTAVAFAPRGAPVLVAGSGGGALLAFRHVNVAPDRGPAAGGGPGEGLAAAEAQLARLEEALRANAVRTGGGGGGGGGPGGGAGGGGLGE